MKSIMKSINKIIISMLLIGMLLGCTQDFEEINEDPNRIAQVSPATLLNPIIYGLATHNVGRSNSITFDLMQVALPFPSTSGGLHRYDVSENIGNSSWNAYYRWLVNIKEMHEASVRVEDANYQAIALTLRAWVYSQLTDLFGPVPMTEASRGEEGKFYPAFDNQQFIYETILAELEQANELYNLDESMIYADDILFKNDISKWQKFTNSLHLRLLLRISNRPEVNAFEKLETMISNPAKYPVFMSNEESAILEVTGEEPNRSPWSRPQDFRLNTAIAEFFIDNLNQLEDPRRPVIATEARDLNGDLIGYKGIPSGYDGPDSQFDYTASTFNIEQVSEPMQILLLTYAEVEFIKAEVALVQSTGSAEEHYENGVEAAMEMWGAELSGTYFDNPLAQFDGTLERIMLQKYYALYFTDYQQWFEYRRTGFPVLPTTPAMENNRIMPSRFTYPDNVQINNHENYQEAVRMIGTDDINTKVWWDVD
jgi:hypothetical protein